LTTAASAAAASSSRAAEVEADGGRVARVAERQRPAVLLDRLLQLAELHVGRAQVGAHVGDVGVELQERLVLPDRPLELAGAVQGARAVEDLPRVRRPWRLRLLRLGGGRRGRGQRQHERPPQTRAREPRRRDHRAMVARAAPAVPP
jgi:hypothetical protein